MGGILGGGGVGDYPGAMRNVGGRRGLTRGRVLMILAAAEPVAICNKGWVIVKRRRGGREARVHVRRAGKRKAGSSVRGSRPSCSWAE